MHKKIGIWGLGVGGTSLLKFLAPHGHQLQVMDKRIPTTQEKLFLESLGIQFIPQDHAMRFFEYNDTIIASPGIDISEVREYHYKFISELDLFYTHWGRNCIAITGSVGKTTLVSLLETILKHYTIPAITGGNIGIGMLDLIDSSMTTALLELSSFQLEHSTSFAPDLAIISNLFANHLDRHKTIESYFSAKYQLLKHQNIHQKALIPLELSSLILAKPEMHNRPLCFFTMAPITSIEFSHIRPSDTLYFIQDDIITRYSQGEQSKLITINQLPDISYKTNWLILVAAIDILGKNLEQLTTIDGLKIPAHRCELVATHKGVSYYNDSKSTVSEATLAAVEKLQSQPIHLLLGGLSKGVNREPLIAKLKNKVASIICFGAEAAELLTFCKSHAIPSEQFDSLQLAFEYVVSIAQAGDAVLLSPAGSSFDLFKDYKHRGEIFTQLTQALLR